MSRWLFNEEDIQNDLLILKEKYKNLGFDLSIEECYDSWYLYSEQVHANWLNIGENIEDSLYAVKAILRSQDETHRINLSIKNNCTVKNTCINENCMNCIEYSQYDFN